MKATVNPTSLLKELKKMSLVIKKTTVIPILSSVKFEFDKNKLRITGTDLETTYISTIDCDCDGTFSVIIVYQDITEICGSLFTPLSIEVNGNVINFVCGKWKSKLSVMGETELFPTTETAEYFIEFEADGDFFYNLSIANTCKNNDDPRMNMPAISIEKKCINIVGTDSNVLYKKELPIKLGKELTTMVSSNLALCCKSFQDSKVFIGEKFIKVENGNDIIVSRLSEQKFPNYKAVIRNDIVYNMTINREELKSALMSIYFAANFTYKQVVVTFLDGAIKLQSQNIDAGKEGETEIEVEHRVEFPQIGFNADKLMHFLNVLSSETVDFSFISLSGSIYIKPSDDETIFCLIQPVVITN